MAQFDLLIIFPIMWSLFITLILNYKFLIDFVIPQFSGLLKIRKKVLKTFFFKVESGYKISIY